MHNQHYVSDRNSKISDQQNQVCTLECTRACVVYHLHDTSAANLR